MAELKDLGYVNGWGGEYPPEYQQHLYLTEVKKEIHDSYFTMINNSTTHREFKCNTCGFKYRIDSSG